MEHMRHIVSTKQFLDRGLLDELFVLADTLRKVPRPPQWLRGKILASLFYEPSTRTRFSFEAAMQKLGGMALTTENARQFSSAAKGETLEDSVRVIGGYCDGIILRYHEAGGALCAARVSPVPVVNAGDGDGEHPTQALLDLYTIESECGDPNQLQIALTGDLLYGRTIHSLVYLLSLYPGVRLDLVSPPSLRLPEELRSFLRERGIRYRERGRMEDVLPDADVIYCTRVQKERFQSPQTREPFESPFRLDREMLSALKPAARILHPLPRVHEIASEVDCDPRAAYFREARNGLFIRMSLLLFLLA